MSNSTTKKKDLKQCFPPRVRFISLKEKSTEDMNLKTKIKLGESAIRYDSTIHEAYHMRYGISGWYKAYIASEDFQNESNYFKKQSFETYQNLVAMFDFMEPVIDQFDKTVEDL